MSEPIVYTYRGEDRFYGVPRRSLTQADFDALTPTQQQDVIASSSYVPRKATGVRFNEKTITVDVNEPDTGEKEG